MILIPCPHCGPRNSDEFSYHGEFHDVAGDSQWQQAGRTLRYERDNLADWTEETWFHRFGCERFFFAERHTVTNEVRATRTPRPQTEYGSW